MTVNHRSSLCMINRLINNHIFVLEMHNDKNNIMGIGIIKNKLVLNKRPKIYKDYNYNFYIYKSRYRVDRNELTKKETKIIKILDILLFKGYRHVKRGQGIIRIPEWIIKNKHLNFIYGLGIDSINTFFKFDSQLNYNLSGPIFKILKGNKLLNNYATFLSN